MKTLEELRKYFENDGFVKYCGMEILAVDKEKALVKAPIFEKHLNAIGIIHGGMLFSIADFAFGVLANYLHPITVTASGSITYVAPCANSAFITAEAREIARYNKTCVQEITVRDDKGMIVCIAQLNGFIKQ